MHVDRCVEHNVRHVLRCWRLAEVLVEIKTLHFEKRLTDESL